jgi:hypothetical protein
VDWVGFAPMDAGSGWVAGSAASPGLFANQSLEVRTEGIFREAAGGGNWGPTPPAYGDLPRLPPAGLEARTSQIIVFTSRGDLVGAPDSAVDDLSIRISYRPCWLHIPVA